MRLSEQKRAKLYEAIDEPITQLRLDIQRHGSPPSEMLDRQLSQLGRDIWRGVFKALNIDF